MENQSAPVEDSKVGGEQSQTVSPADNNSQQSASPSDNGVKTIENNLPFDKHPRFKELLTRTKNYEKELQKIRDENLKYQGYIDSLKNQSSQQSGLSQEDEQNLERLTNLMFSSPKVMNAFREKFGLSKIDQLEKGVSELSQSWNSSQSEAEMSSILEHAKGLGLNPEEVREEIESQIDSHPLYSQLSYKQGALKAIYRDLFFDRAGEIRERAENKKKIEERDKLKNGNVQTNSASQTAGTKKGSNSFADLIKQAGGMGNIDFNK